LKYCFSGGTDNIVNLWRIASCSSAPWLDDAVTASSLLNGKSEGISERRTSSSKEEDESSGEDSGFAPNDDEVEQSYRQNADRLVADPPDIKVFILNRSALLFYFDTILSNTYYYR
jgi:hypothetical protein